MCAACCWAQPARDRCTLRKRARRCSSKQLWELVNDADAVAAEREKAAKNKNKYTGADRFGIAPGQSTSHSPAPSFGSTDASVTRPAASGGDGAAPLGGGASGGEDDAVAATERRVQQLSVGGSDAGGAASPRAGNARPKPKLSSIAVRISAYPCTQLASPHSHSPRNGFRVCSDLHNSLPAGLGG